MAVAAAEATVGLSIVIAIYRNKKTPLVDEYDAMTPVMLRRCSIPLIIALPLAGFLFTAVVGRRLGKQAHLVPVGAVGLAWADRDDRRLQRADRRRAVRRASGYGQHALQVDPGGRVPGRRRLLRRQPDGRAC